MEQQNNTTHRQINNTHYSNKIITHFGVYFNIDKISEDTYEKITYMKICGDISDKLNFKNFVNLKKLDICAVTPKKILDNDPKIYFPTTLKIDFLENLKTLKFSAEKSCVYTNDKTQIVYPFLNNLPINLTTIIIVEFNDDIINELNLSNISTNIKKIDLYSTKDEILKKRVDIETLRINIIKKLKIPFECDVYFNAIKVFYN